MRALLLLDDQPCLATGCSSLVIKITLEIAWTQFRSTMSSSGFRYQEPTAQKNCLAFLITTPTPSSTKARVASTR
jgi:hypothetical protein